MVVVSSKTRYEGDGGEEGRDLVKSKRANWRAAVLARTINARRARRAALPSSKEGGPPCMGADSSRWVELHQMSARDLLSFKALSCAINGHASQQAMELYRQTDQQYHIQRDLTRLHKDLRKLLVLSRVKVERLRFVQQRLFDMRAKATATSKDLTADEEVNKHLLSMAKDERSLETFRTCSLCGRKVLRDLLEDHQDYCEASDKAQLAHDTSHGREGDRLSKQGGDGVDDMALKELLTLECPYCGRKFPGKQIPDKHTRRCQQRESRRLKNKEDEEEGIDMKGTKVEVKTVPYPPRDVVVLHVGPSWIKLGWKPPILDGGALVYDHEISFSRRRSSKVGRNNTITEVEPQPPVRTSRWCLNAPVCNYGFVLDGLRAETDYIDIKVRVRNEAGWSDYSEPVPSIRTFRTVGPSAPVNIMAGRPTQSCIPLSWGTPKDDGGRDIVDYEVSYIEMVKAKEGDPQPQQGGESGQHEDHDNQSKYLVEPKEIFFRIGRARNSCVIRNLISDSDYFDITVRAINDGGFLGEPAVIQYVRTRMPNYKVRLEKELVRAKNGVGKYIETNFFSHIRQREIRHFYVKKLTEELAKFNGIGDGEDEVLLDEQEEGDGLDVSKPRPRVVAERDHEVDEETKAKQEAIVPMYYARLRYFTYRIKYLQLEIEQAEEARIKAIADRSRLSHEMNLAQTRRLDLVAEFDRVILFKGNELNSSVVHGSDQRWTKDVLIGELRREIRLAEQRITSAKLEVHQGFEVEMYSIKIKAKKESDLRNRKIAKQLFQTNSERAFRHAGVKIYDKPVDMAAMFNAWRDLVQDIRATRMLVGNAFTGLRKRLLACAWHKWRFGKHLFSNQDQEGDECIISKGSALLHEAGLHRKDLVDRLGDVCMELGLAQQTQELSVYTRPQVQLLMANKHFGSTGHSKDAKPFQRKMVYTLQGDGFYRTGQYDSALRCYDKEIDLLRTDAYVDRKDGLDIKALAIAYGRRGQAFRALRKWDHAILSFDCQRTLALEIEDPSELAESLLGMGNGYYESADYGRAIDLYKNALSKFMEIDDKLAQAAVCKCLCACYQALHVPSMANVFKVKAETILTELPAKISGGYRKLDIMRKALIGVTASESRTISLELVSGLCLRMRREMAAMYKTVQQKEEELEKKKKQLMDTRAKLKKVNEEIEITRSTEQEIFLTRSLGGGEEEAYDIEEFRLRIVDKKAELEKEVVEEQAELQFVLGEIKNIRDEAAEMQKDLDVEQGKLVQAINRKRAVREVALNAANTAIFEVSGRATGGVEQVVASEGANLMVYDLNGGALQHIFYGDEDGRHFGEAEGHLGIITCLFFYKHVAFSGSVDTTIQMWDTRNFKRIAVLRGHESTVLSLYSDHVKLISGGADTNVCIWDSHTGELKMTLPGHKRSVLCLYSGHDMFVSGGADGCVRVWEVKKASSSDLNAYRRIRCISKLKGQGRPLTCLQLARLEVVAGTRDGKVLVWWIQTGEIMKVIQSHVGPVRSLQVDATKVITAGMDQVIAISDLTTGDVIQRLRGHNGSVQAICFDANKILTGSIDCTLRYWVWERDSEGGTKKDRCHIVDQGDTLAKISKIHNVAVADIVKWNGLSGARSINVGMKLIVAKGDPSKPTAAELHAENQKKLAKAKAHRILAAAGVCDPEKEREEKIKKQEMKDILATRREMDKGSFNSRVHLALTKRDDEFVFSRRGDETLYDTELYSLGQRIAGKAQVPGGEKKKASSSIAAGGGDAVENEVEAIFNEAYVPSERDMADEVGEALVNGVIRKLALTIAVEAMLDTSWQTSLLDRLHTIRPLEEPEHYDEDEEGSDEGERAFFVPKRTHMRRRRRGSKQDKDQQSQTTATTATLLASTALDVSCPAATTGGLGEALFQPFGNTTDIAFADLPENSLAPAIPLKVSTMPQQQQEPIICDEDEEAKEAIRAILFPKHSVWGAGGIAARMKKNSTASQEIDQAVATMKKTSGLVDKIERMNNSSATATTRRADIFESLSNKINIQKQLAEENSRGGPSVKLPAIKPQGSPPK